MLTEIPCSVYRLNRRDLVQIRICLEKLVGTFIFLVQVPYSPKPLSISICACVTVPVDVYTVLII